MCSSTNAGRSRLSRQCSCGSRTELPWNSASPVLHHSATDGLCGAERSTAQQQRRAAASINTAQQAAALTAWRLSHPTAPHTKWGWNPAEERRPLLRDAERGGSARRAASSTSSHFGTTISAVASLKLHVPETTNTGSHFCPQEMFTLHPQQPAPPPRAATRPPVPHSPSRSSREARHHATAFHQHQLLL